MLYRLFMEGLITGFMSQAKQNQTWAWADHRTSECPGEGTLPKVEPSTPTPAKLLPPPVDEFGGGIPLGLTGDVRYEVSLMTLPYMPYFDRDILLPTSDETPHVHPTAEACPDGTKCANDTRSHSWEYRHTRSWRPRCVNGSGCMDGTDAHMSMYYHKTAPCPDGINCHEWSDAHLTLFSHPPGFRPICDRGMCCCCCCSPAELGHPVSCCTAWY